MASSVTGWGMVLSTAIMMPRSKCAAEHKGFCANIIFRTGMSKCADVQTLVVFGAQ